MIHANKIIPKMSPGGLGNRYLDEGRPERTVKSVSQNVIGWFVLGEVSAILRSRAVMGRLSGGWRTQWDVCYRKLWYILRRVIKRNHTETSAMIKVSTGSAIRSEMWLSGQEEQEDASFDHSLSALLTSTISVVVESVNYWPLMSSTLLLRISPPPHPPSETKPISM